MKYASILGYGFDCPDAHLEICRELVPILCNNGYGICAGGYIGIFAAAFKAAKEHTGQTLLCTDANTKEIDTQFIDQVIITPTTDEKHDLIVSKSDLVLVIGGGKGTEMLATKFMKADKTMYLVEGTGGAVEVLGKKVNALPIDRVKQEILN